MFWEEGRLNYVSYLIGSFLS